MTMALLPPSLIWLIFAYSHTGWASSSSSSGSFTLSSQIKDFVPPCARVCFESFLQANFPASVCSESPSLECLCSHNSTSGFTVGEGALECIVGEDDVGFCQGGDASQKVAESAYSMCDGEPSALPRTHATLTATLLIEATASSIVVVPQHTTTSSSTKSNTSTKSTGSSSSSSSSSLSSASSSSSRTTSSKTTSATASSQTTPKSSSVSSVSSLSSASTTASSSSTSVIAASLTATTSAAATAAASSSSGSLTSGQVAGIAVGSVAGVALAGAILICIMCIRRKRKNRPERDSDLLPFQNDSTNSLERAIMVHQEKTQGLRAVGGNAGPIRPVENGNRMPGTVSPPVPRRMSTDPYMFSRTSIRPDDIGLAISPDTTLAQTPVPQKQSRRSSKLLPEKPVLTLQVPDSGNPLKSFPSFPLPPQNNPAQRSTARAVPPASRESNATQFEDDTPFTASASAHSYGRRRSDGFVRGSMGNDDPFYPSEPVPRMPMPPPKVYVTPEDRPSQPVEQSTPQQNLRPITNITNTSSVYSEQPSLSNNNRSHISNGIIYPYPLSRAARQASSKCLTTSTGGRASFASSRTSFDSLESANDPEGPLSAEPKTAGTDLSPVAESPASGRSPVTYPKIPGRLGTTIKAIPPPPQPAFQPWRVAELRAQRAREQKQAQQNSYPPTRQEPNQYPVSPQSQGQMRYPPQSQHERNQYQYPAPPQRILNYTPPVPSSNDLKPAPLRYPVRPESQDNNIYNTLPSQRNSIARPLQPQPPYQNQQAYPRPLNRTSFQRPPQPYQNQSYAYPVAPPPRQPPSQFPQKQSYQAASPPAQQPPQSFPQPSAQAPAPIPKSPPHLQPFHLPIPPRSDSAASNHTTATSNTTTSSLLAKRLGPEKASALKLADKEEENRRWRVLKDADIAAAKSAGWRPRLVGQPTNTNSTNNANNVNTAEGYDSGYDSVRRNERRKSRFATGQEKMYNPRDGRASVDVYGNGGTGDGFLEAMTSPALTTPRFVEVRGGMAGRQELPGTPGWVPRLTPTRRGDELYLDVQ